MKLSEVYMFLVGKPILRCTSNPAMHDQQAGLRVRCRLHWHWLRSLQQHPPRSRRGVPRGRSNVESRSILWAGARPALPRVCDACPAASNTLWWRYAQSSDLAKWRYRSLSHLKYTAPLDSLTRLGRVEVGLNELNQYIYMRILLEKTTVNRTNLLDRMCKQRPHQDSHHHRIPTAHLGETMLITPHRSPCQPPSLETNNIKVLTLLCTI